ncbi:unnamed protein product [Moneuplotes crassus]|uniref:AP2/ERF domain-containing protein n=1 Tax=Euplotes crassus TaxID=5936 RepID=A0AAD2CYZ0_EUPCR|nr:unnamed protein product [Moneuplotes crassus]
MNCQSLLEKLSHPLSLGLETERASSLQEIVLGAYLSASKMEITDKIQVSSLGLFCPPFTCEVRKESNTQDPKTSDAKGACIEDKAQTQQLSQMEFDSERLVLDLNCSSDPSAPKDSLKESEIIDLTSTRTVDLVPKSPLKPRRTKKKFRVDRNNIEEFTANERRRLMKKLQSCSQEKLIFQKRIKKVKKDPKISEEDYRGSKYWGVSKNKARWQVMITLNHYKEYKGGFETEDEAAKMYDKKSICTFGLKAKTNFNYNKRQVLEILNDDEIVIM